MQRHDDVVWLDICHAFAYWMRQGTLNDVLTLDHGRQG